PLFCLGQLCLKSFPTLKPIKKVEPPISNPTFLFGSTLSEIIPNPRIGTQFLLYPILFLEIKRLVPLLVVLVRLIVLEVTGTGRIKIINVVHFKFVVHPSTEI